MLVSVIIPCYNEIKFIKQVLDEVIEESSCRKEIILVDDCSTDGTRELIKDELMNRVDKVIFHEKNQGKGAAIRSGIRSASGQIILIQDADLEYSPKEYEKLLKPIIDGKADVVYGSRFLTGEAHRVLYFWHSVGNKFLTLISNMFTNLNLTDMETCYKVIAAEYASKIDIKEDRFGFEPEITAKLAAMNARFFEVGISYFGRTYDDGKKINWRDGFRAIYCILKYNLFK